MESKKGIVEALRKPLAGMTDMGADFFKENGKLYVSHNWRTKEWPDFPPYVMNIIREDMLANPVAMKCLGEWENLLPEEYEYRYIACNFGGNDDEPDIDVDGVVHQSEYVPCRLRGECRFEGKLCRTIKVNNGILTKREMDVLRMINEDSKIIADKLSVRKETVDSHIVNIKEKIGLHSKPQLAVWASKKGII